MHTAPPSWRAATKRAPRAWRLAVTVKFPLPTTPKTTSAPARVRQRATTSTTFIAGAPRYRTPGGGAPGLSGGGRATRRYGPLGMAATASSAPAALSLRRVVKSFGGRPVLNGADLRLGPRARVGLIGANGSGKSTLLRIVAGVEAPDAGTVTLRKGAGVAHLAQLVTGDERTVRQTIRDARPELAALERELARCEAQLGAPAVIADLDRMARVLERHARLLGRREALGADRLEGDAIRHLRDLGLEERALDRPTARLSGGQRQPLALGARPLRPPH